MRHGRRRIGPSGAIVSANHVSANCRNLFPQRPAAALSSCTMAGARQDGPPPSVFLSYARADDEDGFVRAVHDTGLSGMLWVNFFDSIEFIDKSTGTSLGRVPSYTLVNAKLWYPFRLGKADGRVFLQGFNLLDKVHREHPQGQEYGLLAMAGVEIAW